MSKIIIRLILLSSFIIFSQTLLQAGGVCYYCEYNFDDYTNEPDGYFHGYEDFYSYPYGYSLPWSNYCRGAPFQSRYCARYSPCYYRRPYAPAAYRYKCWRDGYY